MPEIACVIFDMDGTLVDSEVLSCRAYLELIPQLNETLDGMIRTYGGGKFAEITSDIEFRIGRKLPEDFETTYRSRVAELFDQELLPIPGVPEMLDRLTLPRCVASNAPQKKIRHALQVTDLAHHFGDAIFSAYDIQSWKPKPDLFLHAAASLGFTPEQCLVVEDSDTGVRAGIRAGMHVVRYAPLEPENSRDEITLIRDMAELNKLLTETMPRNAATSSLA